MEGLEKAIYYRRIAQQATSGQDVSLAIATADAYRQHRCTILLENNKHTHEKET